MPAPIRKALMPHFSLDIIQDPLDAGLPFIDAEIFRGLEKVPQMRHCRNFRSDPPSQFQARGRLDLQVVDEVIVMPLDERPAEIPRAIPQHCVWSRNLIDIGNHDPIGWGCAGETTEKRITLMGFVRPGVVEVKWHVIDNNVDNSVRKPPEVCRVEQQRLGDAREGMGGFCNDKSVDNLVERFESEPK